MPTVSSTGTCQEKRAGLTKTMKIALVAQEYPPETAHGGIGSQNLMKAQGLAALGHEVHVISHSPDAQRRERRDGEVHVVRIPGPDAQFPIATDAARWVTYSALVAAAVSQLHAKRALDLVDFPDWGSEAFVHLLNQEDWNHIPTVIHLHGPVVMFAHEIGWPDLASDFYRVARMMEETCVRRADAVFSSSRCSARWCAEHYGLNVDRIPVLHAGIDTDRFRPLDLPKDARPTIIFVGKIEKSKGVDVLVDAACGLARELPDLRLRLRLLGRGDCQLALDLEQRTVAAGFPDLLELAGFVPREQLPQHLCRSHVFAAPSVYEGGPGFVYLEAMACGLPVIACSGSGASEGVSDGENGVLVPPGNVGAVAEALRKLFSDAQMRASMGERAHQYVLRHAGREQCIRRLEAFYLEVAQRVCGG